MNDRNYTISARIDAAEFVTVVNDLRKRGVPFASIADVLSITMREYCDAHELEPLTPEQTLVLMGAMGLSTKRVKAFTPGRSGLNGLDKITQAALKILEAAPVEFTNFEGLKDEEEEEEVEE